MRVIAVMCIGRNTFIRIELENFDDPKEQIEADAEALAARLGACFLYLEGTPDA